MANEPIIWDVFGLKISFRGYEFPKTDEFWDANWLNVSAGYSARGAKVDFAGPILRTTEVADFLEQLEALNAQKKDCALLNCLEPYIGVNISRSTNLGGLKVDVDLTPDVAFQRHHFESASDLSYLPAIIHGAKTVLHAFPVKGYRSVL